MKKILAIILTVAMLSTIASAAVENVDSKKLPIPECENALIVVRSEDEKDAEIFYNCKPEVKSGKVKLLLGRLISALDYTAFNKTETDISLSNGGRTIQLFYDKNEAKVDEKTVTLKNSFVVEEKNVYYNYIGIEDIEALFSYKTAYDKSTNNVVLYETEETPKRPTDIPEAPIISAQEVSMEQMLAQLKAYKIFQGDENGNLNLDKEITRAEFCKVICAALGYTNIEDRPEGSDIYYNNDENVYIVSSESIFSDVATTHWAYGYIKTAYDRGLINGVGNNRFCPSDSITEIDAIKIIVSALDYAQAAEQNGGYPAGFRKIAERFGIVTDAPDRPILREKVVQYLYTALDVPLMIMTGYDVATNSATYAIADGKNGIAKYTLRTALDDIYANSNGL